MYTLNKNPLHLKNCVIYKGGLDNKIILVKSLLHTYFSELYEMHSGTFLQQLRRVNGFKYKVQSRSNA
jgi:hypothetical protein